MARHTVTIAIGGVSYSNQLSLPTKVGHWLNLYNANLPKGNRITLSKGSAILHICLLIFNDMSDLLQGVDAIIFDFGNVLIDLDYPRVIREFSEVAQKNQHEIEELVVTAPILQRFERGMSTPEEFRAEINGLLGTQLPEAQFDRIWNSMLLKVPKARMRKVLEIGKRYDTYILSNSNIIHELAFEEMIMEATGRASIRDFVKEVYFSHEIGMRKPNLNAYEHVIEDIDNYPSRMLFLDDRLDNVEAAQKAGMKAVQIFDPDSQLDQLFGLG